MQIVQQSGLVDVSQFGAHQSGYFSEAPPAHFIPDYTSYPQTLDDYYGNFISKVGSQRSFSY
jgi:hypothetical protein